MSQLAAEAHVFVLGSIFTKKEEEEERSDRQTLKKRKKTIEHEHAYLGEYGSD